MIELTGALSIPSRKTYSCWFLSFTRLCLPGRARWRVWRCWCHTSPWCCACWAAPRPRPASAYPASQTWLVRWCCHTASRYEPRSPVGKFTYLFKISKQTNRISSCLKFTKTYRFKQSKETYKSTIKGKRKQKSIMNTCTWFFRLLAAYKNEFVILKQTCRLHSYS